MKELAITDQYPPGRAEPGAERSIATYVVSGTVNDYCALTYARNQMDIEVKQILSDMKVKQHRLFNLRRIIDELEIAMDLESRSNEIAKALAESTELDKAAIISALLKKQELELSK